MNPSKSNTAEILLSQYQSTWEMIHAAIENVPDKYWTLSEGKWWYATTVYHLIETMDFYCRDDYESMVFGKRAGYNWDDVKDIEKDILPLISKELVRTYLSEMEQKLTDFLSSVSEDAFFEKDSFYWFKNVLQKYIYLLRHNQHHLGELAVSLRRINVEPIKWT